MSVFTLNFMGFAFHYYFHENNKHKLKSNASRRRPQARACVYLVVVPLKELQEAGLGPRGPLDPAEAQVIPSPLQVADVHGQVLQPQTRSLPHRGQLGRPDSEKRDTHARNQRTVFSVETGRVSLTLTLTGSV